MLSIEIKKDKEFSTWKMMGRSILLCGLSRLDGPAHIGWHGNGRKQVEAYIVAGLPHRLRGSAVTVWYEDGQLDHRKWHAL